MAIHEVLANQMTAHELLLNIRSIGYYTTTNNVHGNPRRVFVGYNENGTKVITTDEGYAGTPKWVRTLNAQGVGTHTLAVEPKTYNALVRELPALQRAITAELKAIFKD
jgi:hypothetical protein